MRPLGFLGGEQKFQDFKVEADAEPPAVRTYTFAIVRRGMRFSFSGQRAR